MKNIVIAIDGPAASGKSTTSKLIAERLGYLYVDTGAMYRAMTLKVLRQRISPDSMEEIAQLALSTRIRLEQSQDGLRVFLDNADVTKEIRSPEITRSVSAVSMVREVREVMVREQRRMGEAGGVVLEGRDIGTVVFPTAELKIYMVAEDHERAIRRQRDLHTLGVDIPVDELEVEIRERDRKDSGREISPLRRAWDAILVDTSHMTIPEQVALIVEKAERIIHGRTDR